VSYTTNMTSYFGSPVPARLDPRQPDGSAATYVFGQTLDLLMVSPALAGRPHATEIYNSALDFSNTGGLPKAGDPPAAATSAAASDHFAVFGDFELDQDAFNLSLAASAPSVAEGDAATVVLTVTLAEASAAPVTVALSSDDPAAVPEQASVTIGIGDLSASTPVTTTRNFLADGPRTVTFTAAAAGYAEGRVAVELLDADSGYEFREAGEVIVERFEGFHGLHSPAPWTSDAGKWLGPDDGSSSAPGGRSYGNGAPGFLTEGAGVALEATFANGTPVPLTMLDLAYAAAQWRAASGGAADRIEVDLVVDGIPLPVPDLAFHSRTDLPDGPVAGGAPVTLSTRMTGLSIAPGAAIGLRFRFVPGEGAAALPDDVFINEFHYDNESDDQGEFVEIVAGPGFSGELPAVQLLLYNGSSGALYASHSLDGFTEGPPTSSGHRVFSKPISGIQNGSPDGLALVVDGMVAEFLSYEGSFTATEGAAGGMTSTDVGVSQAGASPAGEQSLGLTGSGSSPRDFRWVRFGAGVPHSPGVPNAGQTFTLPGLPSQGLAVDLVTVGFVADADGDGLADEEDPDDDNDGLSDRDEEAFGSDPLDAGSVFEVTVVRAGPGAELRFPGAEGIVYTIERSTDLASWADLRSIEGEGAEVMVSLPSGDGRRFVRVRAGE
jgi:hypothetical protein